MLVAESAFSQLTRFQLLEKDKHVNGNSTKYKLNIKVHSITIQTHPFQHTYIPTMVKSKKLAELAASKKSQVANADSKANASSSSAEAAAATVAQVPFAQDFTNAIVTTFQNYFKSLTPKLMLIDTFLVFLVFLGVIQFGFVLLVGNFPFNAFLAGFIAAVGQFVLTVSLRLQYVERNRKDFPSVTPER